MTTPDDTMPDDPSPDTTSISSPPTPDPADHARSSCIRLTDFEADAIEWFVVNDGVMGGRSNGTADVAESIMRFAGTIVTDGGGFTSIRSSLAGGELAGSDRIEMRIRADDRVYGVILDDEHRIEGRNVSYRTDIDNSGPPDADGWRVVSIPYDSLVPTIFGRVVDSPGFVADEATEIGIIIADGRDGEFVVELDWIDACADS